MTHHHDSVWGSRTGFSLLPDASGFILVSERDGWRHLYLYDMAGNLVRRLTKGDFPVEAVVGVDQESGWVYFTAQTDPARPYDLHLNRVALDGTNRTQLTEGKGRHAVALSPSHGYFVDTYSSVDTPPRSVVRRADGELLLTLSEADIGRLEEVGWTPPREVVVKAADGETDLWVTMYLPHDFDPSRRYPVVEYIYGGPQTTTRPMDFGGEQFPGLGSDFARIGNFNRALANLGVRGRDSRWPRDARTFEGFPRCDRQELGQARDRRSCRGDPAIDRPLRFSRRRPRGDHGRVVGRVLFDTRHPAGAGSLQGVHQRGPRVRHVRVPPLRAVPRPAPGEPCTLRGGPMSSGWRPV